MRNPIGDHSRMVHTARGQFNGGIQQEVERGNRGYDSPDDGSGQCRMLNAFGDPHRAVPENVGNMPSTPHRQQHQHYHQQVQQQQMQRHHQHHNNDLNLPPYMKSSQPSPMQQHSQMPNQNQMPPNFNHMYMPPMYNQQGPMNRISQQHHHAPSDRYNASNGFPSEFQHGPNEPRRYNNGPYDHPPPHVYEANLPMGPHQRIFVPMNTVMRQDGYDPQMAPRNGPPMANGNGMRQNPHPGPMDHGYPRQLDQHFPPNVPPPQYHNPEFRNPNIDSRGMGGGPMDMMNGEFKPYLMRTMNGRVVTQNGGPMIGPQVCGPMGPNGGFMPNPNMPVNRAQNNASQMRGNLETPLLKNHSPPIPSHSTTSHTPTSHHSKPASPSTVPHIQSSFSTDPNSETPRLVYNVKFKRAHRSFILGQRAPRDIKIGCYVKVEADRGEDLGYIVSRTPVDKFNAGGRGFQRITAGQNDGNAATGAADLKRVIRLATQSEVSLLAVNREEEEELLKICRTKVRQRVLPMNVVDAEYQFDRNKLTFFFEAEGRIDFRELVRDLFSIYKTRIWMQQLDKNGSGCGTGGASVSSQDGNGCGGSIISNSLSVDGKEIGDRD